MITRRDVLRYTAATVALTSCGRADAETAGALVHVAEKEKDVMVSP